jgi:hypothetical protein
VTTLAEHRIIPQEELDRSKLKLWISRHLDYPHADCCLIWPFGRHKDGYGTMGDAGKQTYAHRYICRLVHGEPPTPKHQASHSCNRGHDACVNPHHLSWKTPGANHKEGEWHPKIKLSAEKAAEIRALKGLEPVSETAHRYGVREITIRQVQSGRLWRTDRRRGTNGFSDDQIRYIRGKAGTRETQKIADEFGVTYGVIWRIMQRRSWLHVPDDPNLTVTS